MEIYQSVDEINEQKPSAIALGFFDGLHLGHTALLTECVEFAKEHGLSADVFTFRDHPKNIMSGKMLIPRLMPEPEKLDRLKVLGVDRVFDFDFEDHFHTMPPEDFAKTLLADAFCAKAVFCGFNFRFGANAAGTPGILKQIGEGIGFDTFIMDPVYVAGRLVSSTLIRRCINSGDVEPAGRLLGREYSLSGIVEKGRGLGQGFGFPTANFYPDMDMTLPAHGVYITETAADGEIYPSVSNVGICPTIKIEGSLRIETHLLDRDIDLYGKVITVLFKKMLRKERRFEGEEALKKQIAADAFAARQYFQLA